MSAFWKMFLDIFLHFSILEMFKAYHFDSLLFFYNIKGKELDILLICNTYYNKQASAWLKDRQRGGSADFCELSYFPSFVRIIS